MSRIRLLCGGKAEDSPETVARPHILLVVDQFPKALGGGERIVLKLAKMLPAYGYRASILTFAADEESLRSLEPPCPIYLLPLKRTYDLKAFRGALALRQFLKREHVVLVHTCFESSDLWAGGMTKLFSQAKLVWNRRDMGILRSRKHVLAYRWLARMPDAVFAVSEEVRRYTIAVDRVAPTRVITIHNGLDLDQWPERKDDWEKTRPVIATLGNIRRIKGHDVLLRAFATVHLKDPNARLMIGGAVLEPLFMREMQTIIADLRLESSVSFEGPIQNQQSFLQDASMFILPSRSEGFSNAIIEAMASSLPVVATDVGGNAEAVEDEITGFVVASEDVEAMAAALLKLLSDPEKAKVMGVAGRQRALELFTTEAMMRRIVATFDRLLA